jgi:hypothetical protein
MKKILEFKWQIVALALLGGGLALSHGGFTTLLPAVRIIAMVVAALLVLRLIKNRVSGSLQAIVKRQMEAAGMTAGAARGAGPGGKVIDLCPRCGTYLAPGHRCKK